MPGLPSFSNLGFDQNLGEMLACLIGLLLHSLKLEIGADNSRPSVCDLSARPKRIKGKGWQLPAGLTVALNVDGRRGIKVIGV